MSGRSTTEDTTQRQEGVREGRAGLLALAGSAELVALADGCLADGVRLTVLVAPEVGCVATEVLEPVGRERFLLGDVLACRAEVELAGQRGWAMRLGDDRASVLAAAVLDAEAAGAGPRAADVDELCRAVARRQADRDEREWAELAPTIVAFEELT
jgi:alpha-D-ribose 1-methylphosphonate 5-triphosphate synthase subunit PhnG